MLYWLFYEKLYHAFTPFRVFQYSTFRTAFASLTALFLCIVLGPWLIAKLRDFQIGQYIREDGPKSHMKKAGTPTMGGLLIIISIVVPTLLWANLRNPYVWIAMFGLVSVRRDRLRGRLRENTAQAEPRTHCPAAKSRFRSSSAMMVGFILLMLHAQKMYSTSMNVPFFKSFKPDLLIEYWIHNPWYTIRSRSSVSMPSSRS